MAGGQGGAVPALLLPADPPAAVYDGVVLFATVVRLVQANDLELDRQRREAQSRIAR